MNQIAVLSFHRSWLAIARLEAKLCNYQRARDLFSQAVEKCPNNVHILHAWGHMEEVRIPWVSFENFLPWVCCPLIVSYMTTFANAIPSTYLM